MGSQLLGQVKLFKIFYPILDQFIEEHTLLRFAQLLFENFYQNLGVSYVPYILQMDRHVGF